MIQLHNGSVVDPWC